MSPILTEQALHEALVVAQRLRICELESELRQADEALRRAVVEIRTVLEGCGASLLEKLTANAALAEAQGIVMRALIRPRSLTDAPQGALPSAENIESSYVERQPLHVCKVLPLGPRPSLIPPDSSAGPRGGSKP